MKVKGRMAPGPVVRNLRRGKRIPHRQPLKHGNNAEGLGSSAEPGSTHDTANVNASGSNAPLGPVRIVCQEEDAGVLQPTSPNTTRRLGPPTYSARPDTLLTLNPVDDAEDDANESTDLRTATTTPNPVEMVDTADSRRGSGQRQPNTDRS